MPQVENLVHDIKGVLVRPNMDNEWAWKDEEVSLYTMKSAYTKLQHCIKGEMLTFLNNFGRVNS